MATQKKKHRGAFNSSQTLLEYINTFHKKDPEKQIAIYAPLDFAPPIAKQWF